MIRTYARSWWLLALRGVLAIIFGILAFMWPGATALTRIPRSTSDIESERVNATIAPLVDE